jgi:hypothetical protein
MSNKQFLGFKLTYCIGEKNLISDINNYYNQLDIDVSMRILLQTFDSCGGII